MHVLAPAPPAPDQAVLGTEAAREMVARGAALFDRLRPGWTWDKIRSGNWLVDTDLIDLGYAHLCPAGQVFGDYWNLPILADLAKLCRDDAVAPPGVDEVAFDKRRAAARVEADQRTMPLGLAAYPENREVLRRAWIEEIERRRAAGRPAPTTTAGAA